MMETQRKEIQSDAQFFMAIIFSALTSNCDCETCRLCRKYAQKIKTDIMKIIGD